MKPIRNIIVSAIVFSSLILIGCQNSDKQPLTKKEEIQTVKDVREIVWKLLTDSERAEAIGDWKDATVIKVKADSQRFHLKDPSFDGKEVNMVTIRSTKSAILGDIIILVDEDSQKVIGGGYRE